MLVISKTPLRISFFGGGTDYPAYYSKKPGAVLGTTIDQYTHISVKTLNSAFFDHSIRIGYSKTELVKTVDDIEHPSIRECLKHRKIKGNLDIHIFADLPARTGLGSSSSFTVGFLHALSALVGQIPTKKALALEACHVEHNLIRENVGFQDQYHAAFGGLNRLEFTNKEILVSSLDVPHENLKTLEKHLMIFYTGVTRMASEVAKEQIKKTERGDNMATLNHMFDMVACGEQILKTASGETLVQEFGQLLERGWELKKSLSAQISTPLIDEAYEKAKKGGAVGGKLCGAGGGGFLALVVPLKNQNAVKNRLKPFPQVPFLFEDEGSTVIYRNDALKAPRFSPCHYPHISINVSS